MGDFKRYHASHHGRWAVVSTLALAAAGGCGELLGGADQPPELAAARTTSAQVVRGVKVRPVRTATRRFDELVAAASSVSRPRPAVVVHPPQSALPTVAPGPAPLAAQPLVLPAPTLPSPALDANIFGTTSSGWTPPDTMGAVGPNHLLIAVNGKVQIQDRAGTVLSSTDLYGFFSSVAPSGFTFDPSAFYDPLGGRFVVFAMSGSDIPDAAVVLAVSQTDDPTGAWHFFAFDVDPNGVGWPDFGKLGVNKNWIVTHTPIINSQNSLVLVCDKAAMYAGAASCTSFAPTHMRSRPSISFDADQEKAYLLRIMTAPSDGRIAIDTISGPVGDEVLTLDAHVLTLPESFASQSGETMPQLGSDIKLWSDPGGNVSSLMERDGYFWGSLTMCFPFDVPPTRCGLRYFQSTPTGTLVQYGGIDDPSGVLHSTYASLAVNKNHDLLIGFARFTAEQYPAAAYAYRAGSDPANVLRADAVYRPGEAPNHNVRWGDYTAAMVDPVNDVDLWTLQEYTVPVSSMPPSSTWALQWAKMGSHGPTSAVMLAPVADAYVQDGASAATNFGTAASLLVKATASTGTNRWAYLRFPLTGVNGTVNAARLRLFGSRPTTANGIPDVVYAVNSNGWTESGITWNNKPAVGAAQGFGVAIHTNAHYYEWDVTPFVKAQKSAGATAVSLAVRMSANVTIGPDSFSSRQAAANRPQLVVAYATAADAPPFIVQPATAHPNPVTGTTSMLSVLAGDDQGEANLTYTWSALGPAPVVFSAGNGSNAGKNLTATFSANGSYTLTATVKDASNQTITSSVVVTVMQSQQTVTLDPVADAHVRDGTSAGTNFGTATRLESKNSTVSGNHRRTFLRFAIGGVGSSVSAATLRLHGNSVTTAKMVGVYANSNVTWGETTITWNNAPVIGPKQGPSQSVGTSATYVEWDVTSYVAAQKADGATAVTFEMRQDLANNEAPSGWSSREAASNRPQLVITSGGEGDNPPTVAEPAAASPNPAPGTTTALSVLGADDMGEGALTYTWSGPAGVTFSGGNGTNAGKNLTATFSAAGSVTLTVSIKDAANQAISSSVAVNVVQTLTSIVVSPASANVPVNGSVTFSATARDQFGGPLASQPTFGWSVSGGGTMDGAQFIAGGTAGGPFNVTASSGGVDGIAQVTVTGGDTTVTLGAEADAHVRDGTSASTNFGTATLLESKNSTVTGNHRRTFVRFPITGVGSTVSAATLRLVGNSVTTAKMVGVHANSNITWGETTITWNNAPAIGPKQGTSRSVGTTSAAVTWDVTSYVAAQKAAGAISVTFELKQDVANNETPTTFASRQNATTANRPQLTVTSSN